MHIFALVDDVRRVVDTLRERRGDLTLAMLYNSDGMDASRGWNLIVAAPWADVMGRADAIHAVVEVLSATLPAENSPTISRVTVLKTSDPFVRDMTFLYQVAAPVGPGVPVPQITAGDITEGSGYIFYSQKPVEARQ